MCIMRRCSINGSGTSGNEYSQGTIRRLLEYKPIIVLPFFFLHFFFSVRGFLSFVFLSLVFHRLPACTPFALVTFKNVEGQSIARKTEFRDTGMYRRSTLS